MEISRDNKAKKLFYLRYCVSFTGEREERLSKRYKTDNHKVMAYTVSIIMFDAIKGWIYSSSFNFHLRYHLYLRSPQIGDNAMCMTQ